MRLVLVAICLLLVTPIAGSFWYVVSSIVFILFCLTNITKRNFLSEIVIFFALRVSSKLRFPCNRKERERERERDNRS